jgi:hypothetical protein
MQLVRRLAAPALALFVVGCQQAIASPATPVPGPTPAPERTLTMRTAFTVGADFPPAVARPVVRRPKPPPLPTLPDGSRELLPGHRVVAFYGAAGAPALGVLGTAGPEALWPQLARQARAYRTDDRKVLKAYELIAFVATQSRGNQGNYSSRVPDATIDRYARVAKRHDALLLLDIQPGRGRFRADAKSLRPWLRLPYVGLALDPEWKLYGGELPLQHIGHVYASEVNETSRWLNRLSKRYRLPQKLFLIHEFTDDMVRNKEHVRERTRLATVFNIDGFGSRAAKVGKYRDFASERRTPLGFKLFYDWDVALLSARDVLHLRPAPVVVEYQ